MKSRKRQADPYGFRCEYCDGTVRRKVIGRELIQMRKGDYVALENVSVGVCSKCSVHYYSASVLHQAEALYRKGARRQVSVPVARYDKAV